MVRAFGACTFLLFRGGFPPGCIFGDEIVISAGVSECVAEFGTGTEILREFQLE